MFFVRFAVKSGAMSSLARRFVLLAILAAAAFFRLWRLDHIPPGFHFDEAFEGLESWRILTDPTYRPLFLAGNFGVAPLNAYANALVFALFDWMGGEAGPIAMRVTAACAGVLTVLAVYALATELQRNTSLQLAPSFPLFSAATLAVMRWHIHFSRMGIEPIFTPLLWAASLWLLLHGWRTGRWASFASCGVLLAASMYAYQGAWIIPLLAALVGVRLLAGGSQEESKAQREKHQQPGPPPAIHARPLGLLLAGLVAAILFAPLGWYFWQHPDLLVLRPAQVAADPAGESVWRGVWATLQMFSPLGASPGDLDPRRNLPGAPALNRWLAFPFFLGLGLALWRIRRLSSLVLLSGLAGLLLPGMLSAEAPHFHRVLGAAAPTALLCGLGLERLWRLSDGGQVKKIENGKEESRSGAGRVWLFPTSYFLSARRLAPPLLRWATLFLLLCGAFVSARDYFWRWARLPDLYYAFDAGLWEVGQRLAAMPGDLPLYLTPRDASHPTLAFALRTRRPSPVSFDGRHVFPLTAGQTTRPELYAVIEHEDFRTGLLLPELFPTATAQEASRDPFGRIYARFYIRPAGAPPQRPPQQPFAVALGDGVRLAGYDVQPATLRAGEILYLQLHWLVDSPPQADWTVFTHLLAYDAAGNITVVAGRDSRPGAGSLPTTRWQAGWRILDEYQLALPAELAPGVYALEIGLYQENGVRLPAGVDGLRLGEVTIE